MDSRHYWEENGHGVKFENYSSNDDGYRVRGNGCSEQLNFATAPSEDEGDYQQNGYLKKGKVSRQDPMSHRIIEKRRRDRMNNCLADLSRLIPTEYLKKGRGRVEKTEIIEMAIRHLKYLQDRTNNANLRQGATEAEHYRAGFQEATSEALRYLVEAQGFRHGDELCEQLNSHLQRHCNNLIKVEEVPQPSREKSRNNNGSPETTSSSVSSSHGYTGPPPLMVRADTQQPTPSRYMEFDAPREQNYSMDCDGVSMINISNNPDESVAPSCSATEAETLNCRQKINQDLKSIRKPEHSEDFLHSYKFKNSIERRFSRSQDYEVDPKYKIKRAFQVHDMSIRSTQNTNGKVYTHKRRRAAVKQMSTSTSTSNSGSTEDTSPQDTSSESPHNHYEKSLPPSPQLVPIFALNALGKYYVPLNVDYNCLSKRGRFDVLAPKAVNPNTPLHPITISVNFEPTPIYHVKQEEQHNDREWQP